jgi:hypothetical protein
MTGISQTNIYGNPYALCRCSLKKNKTINDKIVILTGNTKPVVKKERKSSLPSLKKSVEVDWITPIDKKGIRKSILLLKRLRRPFSDGRIYNGLVKTKSNKKDAPFAKKLVNV